MRLSRGVAAVTAAALTAAGLAACAPQGPTLEQIRASVGEALDAVPGVGGSRVTVHSAGLSGSGLTVRISVVDTSRLTEVIDGALEAAWMSSPVDPEGVAIQAYDGPFADDVGPAGPSGPALDLTTVAEQLGFADGEAGTGVDSSGMLLSVADHRLAARYGARPEGGDD